VENELGQRVVARIFLSYSSSDRELTGQTAAFLGCTGVSGAAIAAAFLIASYMYATKATQAR
jgi:hypothetical protein